MKLICSALIHEEAERKAFMSWVRTAANGGFSELGDTVNLIYELDEQAPESIERWQKIVRVFEALPNHSILRVS